MEKISPETLEEKPAQSAFKPLYILMAVLIIFTPLGLLASGTAWGEWGVEEMASLVSNGKALGYTPALEILKAVPISGVRSGILL